MILHPPGDRHFRASVILLSEKALEPPEVDLYKTKTKYFAGKALPQSALKVYAFSLYFKAPWRIYSQLHNDANAAISKFWDALKNESQAGVICQIDTSVKLHSLENSSPGALLVGLGAKSVPKGFEGLVWEDGSGRLNFISNAENLKLHLRPFAEHGSLAQTPHRVDKLLLARSGESFKFEKL